MRCWFLVITFVGLASPAFACMNDVESSRHEREFRSEYGEETSETPPPIPFPMTRWSIPALSGVGVACLTGALFLAASRRSKV